MEDTLEGLAAAVQVAGIELEVAGERRIKAEQAFMDAEQAEGKAHVALMEARRNLMKFIEGKKE